jgi:hypothetical protein
MNKLCCAHFFRKSFRLFFGVGFNILIANCLPLGASENNPTTLHDVFPTLSPEIISAVKSKSGYYNAMEGTDNNGNYQFKIIPSSKREIHFNEIIAEKNPDAIIEMLLFLPYKVNKTTVTDIYNAIINVRDLEGRKYFSDTRKKMVPLFDYVIRIDNMKNKKEIGDPPYIKIYPEHEDIYIKTRDPNFGNCYYHIAIDTNSNSITCMLNNADSFDIFFIPVLKAENLEIRFYVEPLGDGIIMYAVTGVQIGKIIAKHISVSSAFEKRFNVIKDWLIDGIIKYSVP